MTTYSSDAACHLAESNKGVPKIAPEGLFGPKSIAWKVNREQVTLLGGPAAAVLQIAHPKVARGVADHSDFRDDSYGRLKRTLAAVRTITFGTRREVLQVAGNIHKMHQRVKAAADQRGEGYSAFDPDLQMWVLATLVSGAISTYEQFVGVLQPHEKEAYFQDMRIWGEFFGLPGNYGPQNWGEFEDYFNEMIHGSVLGSDPLCAEVAVRVVYPERPFLFKVSTWPLQYLATELIPSPLLERLGLKSGPWTKLAWSATRALGPSIYSILPETLRFPVEYRNARKLWPRGRVSVL